MHSSRNTFGRLCQRHNRELNPERDVMAKKKGSIGSLRSELIRKSREAALSAIRTYNDPLIRFKSETYIVLMMIAWTYLLHAYYRSKKIDYRYFDQLQKRRRFHRTKRGAYKYWELERSFRFLLPS